MMAKLEYEWDIETFDIESGDILEHDPQESFADCLDRIEQWPAEDGQRLDAVLVRDEDDHGRLDRTWAYMQDGKLPENFRDARDCEGPKVPQRFHREVANENSRVAN